MHWGSRNAGSRVKEGPIHLVSTMSLKMSFNNFIFGISQVWRLQMKPATRLGLEALSVSAWCIHFCNCISQKKIVLPQEHRSCWRRVKQQNYKFWKTVDMHTIEWRKILRGQFFCLKTLVTKFINFAHTSTLIDQPKKPSGAATCTCQQHIHELVENVHWCFEARRSHVCTLDQGHTREYKRSREKLVF